MTDATTVLARCAELDRFSASPHYLERVYLSAEHRLANEATAAWMTQAGLRTWVDAAGNINGRRGEGAALLLGSHLDTVPDAGSYDGMLGVMIAIAVAERLRHVDLPFALEVIGFSDEEGTRFGKALLGSQAVAGLWNPDWWDLRDKDGVKLLRAFEEFGLDPARIGEAHKRDLVAYLEAHIEQGPELEAADRSLGVVTTIAGARRFKVSVMGEARHAGGTPYPRRRDALAGAADMVLAVERLGKATGTIATVGRLEASPGAVNVIAGRVDFSVDLRAEHDADRDAVWQQMHDEMAATCAARGLTFSVTETHRAQGAPCASWLQQAVSDGIAATGDHAPLRIWSRAGHDAMAIQAGGVDMGMLFIRCFDGISHHPGEDVREVDVARAIDAFERAVLQVAAAFSASEELR